MKSLKMALSYGFLVWLIPFVVSVIVFPLHTSDRALFESIMAVMLVLSVVSLTIFYFKKHNSSLREGIFLGVLWLLINLGIDFLFFIWGPGKMTIPNYIKDIGLTYLIIPAITIGYGYLEETKEINPKT